MGTPPNTTGAQYGESYTRHCTCSIAAVGLFNDPSAPPCAGIGQTQAALLWDLRADKTLFSNLAHLERILPLLQGSKNLFQACRPSRSFRDGLLDMTRIILSAMPKVHVGPLSCNCCACENLAPSISSAILMLQMHVHLR